MWHNASSGHSRQLNAGQRESIFPCISRLGFGNHDYYYANFFFQRIRAYNCFLPYGFAETFLVDYRLAANSIHCFVVGSITLEAAYIYQLQYHWRAGL
jgi:hypothetical protein